MKTLDQAKKVYASYVKVKEASPSHNNQYNGRETLSKQLHHDTKVLLETQSLTGAQKRELIDLYVKTWKENDCFYQYKREFPAKRMPNFTGFDLSGIDANGLDLCSTFFRGVNFEGADFTQVQFVYSKFEDCNLRNIKTSKFTNLNKVQFYRCFFEGTRLNIVPLSEGRFESCILLDTAILDNHYLYMTGQCTVRRSIGLSPNTCQDLALNLFDSYSLDVEKVTPEELAQAMLHVADHHDYPSIILQVGLWLEHKQRDFGLNEVEAAFEKAYKEKVLSQIVKDYQSFAQQFMPPQPQDAQETQRKALSKVMYHYTKALLDSHPWNGQQKRVILDKYRDAWRQFKCSLDLADTEYAAEYKNQTFSKYSTEYNKNKPMLAGFNLSGLNATDYQLGESTFIRVNFQGAQFHNASLFYSHFEDCNLTNIDTDQDTNFNQCVFQGCNLSNSDLAIGGTSEGKFKKCNLTNTGLSSSTHQGYFGGISVKKCIGFIAEESCEPLLTMFENHTLNEKTQESNVSPIHYSIKGSLDKP